MGRRAKKMPDSDDALYLIVDAKTGEVREQFNDGDRLVRAASLKMLESTEKWEMSHFYKTNSAEVKKVMPELTTGERALFVSLAPYVGYTDCCLKHSNGDVMSFEHIVIISGMSRGAVSTALCGLIDKDILYRGRNSKEIQYFMNPWLVCCGCRINKVLQTMFQNYRIRTYGGVRWKDYVKCEGL